MDGSSEVSRSGQQGRIERRVANILATGMRRRKFIAVVGAILFPLGARAQYFATTGIT